jgi:hypothetical protein
MWELYNFLLQFCNGTQQIMPHLYIESLQKATSFSKQLELVATPVVNRGCFFGKSTTLNHHCRLP